MKLLCCWLNSEQFVFDVNSVREDVVVVGGGEQVVRVVVVGVTAF